MHDYWKENALGEFEVFLKEQERSEGTIQKYRRDILAFQRFMEGETALHKEAVLKYRGKLSQQYASVTVNSMLAAVNGFLRFIGREDCRVHFLKIQNRVFRSRERDLSKTEYLRLLEKAEELGNTRLRLIMETICSTGIRVGELPFIDVRAVVRGQAEVACKGKRRVVLLPRRLRERLKRYCRCEGIREGSVFCTSGGNPVNRSNIWREMKQLARLVGISGEKVFPHNLRHLFAKVFYSQSRDIAKLADILGHYNIQTTRLYLMDTGAEHEKMLNRMGLVP